jgi:FMN phosphatase YigB (HAD superfamily)
MEYLVKCCEKHGWAQGSLENLPDATFSNVFPGIGGEKAQEIFERFVNCSHWQQLHEVPPPPECILLFRELKREGFKLIIVSARERRFETITRTYLSAFFGDDVFDDVFLCNYYGKTNENNPRLTKSEVFLVQNCFTMIDDNYKYVLEVEETTGKKCVLFGKNSWTSYARTRFDRWMGPNALDWRELDVAFFRNLQLSNETVYFS